MLFSNKIQLEKSTFNQIEELKCNSVKDQSYYLLNITSLGTQASGYLQRLWIQSGHPFQYETVTSLLYFDYLNENGTFT